MESLAALAHESMIDREFFPAAALMGVVVGGLLSVWVGILAQAHLETTSLIKSRTSHQLADSPRAGEDSSVVHAVALTDGKRHIVSQTGR